MTRRDGSPILVGTGPLARLDLQPGAGVAYDEAWLQRLLHEYPAVFPMAQIEPGFSDLIPICRELLLTFGAGRTGSLDNVLVTAEGGLVLVEAKLWRNPQARREVVAQALDYAAAVFALDYERFDAACRRARGDQTPLAEVVRRAASDGFDEGAFVDALTRALRRGRAVVAVVGDGIREDVEALAGLLQSHAGDRFTFALVEFGIYGLPDGGHLVVPSVLARTVLIERGVVRIEDGAGLRISVTPPAAVPIVPSGTGLAPRVDSLTLDAFLEAAEAQDPQVGQPLRDFLAGAEALGFRPEVVKRTLHLRHDSGETAPFNVGYVYSDLRLDTGGASKGGASKLGRLEPGRRYSQRLADLTGGYVQDAMGGTECWLKIDGRMPRLTDLLPRHRDAWLAAMADYVAEQRRED